MPRMTMTAARRELSEAVNKMVYGKGDRRIVLSRRGGKASRRDCADGGSEAHGGDRRTRSCSAKSRRERRTRKGKGGISLGGSS